MLVIDISINRERHITTVGVRRLSPNRDTVDGLEECTYEVGRVYEGKIKRPVGEITHIYGDGAEVLASKALTFILETGGSALEEDNFERLLRFAELDK